MAIYSPGTQHTEGSGGGREKGDINKRYYSLGLFSSARSQAQSRSESIEMGLLNPELWCWLSDS